MEPLNESEILAHLDSGLAVVVRLSPFRKPYSPFLRDLKARGLLVRISRPGPWGNPFPLAKGAGEVERAAVISAYAGWLDGQPELLTRLPELAGKALGCYCAPLACHGDVLSRRINGSSSWTDRRSSSRDASASLPATRASTDASSGVSSTHTAVSPVRSASMPTL